MRINPKKNITTWGSLVPGATMKRPGVPYAELYRRRLEAKSTLLYARVVVSVPEIRRTQRMSRKAKRRLFLADMREDLSLNATRFTLSAKMLKKMNKMMKKTVKVTFPKVKGAVGYRLYRRIP